MSPSDTLPSVEGPLAADRLAEAVGDALPDADLREATPIEAGKNAAYRLVVASDGDERELVLKVGDGEFAGGYRAEPRVLSAVGERTAIPVPEVVGTGAFGDDPYFLAERVPGANPACDPESLPPEAFERVCAAAGRNLAALHDAFPAGDCDLIPADGWGMLAFDSGADALHFAREFPDWSTYFEAWLTRNVERLADTRFDDLRPALADRAEEFAADVRTLAPFESVLTHGDYRLGNLLVDPESGATNGVVDWATPTAAPPTWELAVTEAILIDWPALDDSRQERLRTRLYEGYREVNPEPLDGEGFETHRRRCRFGARLRLMVNLGEEMAGRSESAVEARAREHREALREFGVEA
ncbi:aminoglycoside phosphotransferase family protein [Halorussus gelatinilyticus]|uniref:Aminoglycoside phosphotransferase family protein n=1 Tax=Halorussus gelatinilyticus TaxID=2937524 RepID=A0A8U0ICS3_9EURY|nr:aminoglycoside phosphotransferase family protein [Halorussus gelatinilyticus]UPV98839.1 aminoglycoside phosphotransferase family protein [Halorussus gelatinilyticus]